MAEVNLQVTSLSDLERYAQGQIVELPPFAEGQRFVARIRRPSMLAMVKGGKIPNSLMKTAGQMFADGLPDLEANEGAVKDLFGVLDCVADACLVEPSLKQLKDSGLELSDDQYMFIFNYTQRGVKALESFRRVSAGYEPDIDGARVPEEA